MPRITIRLAVERGRFGLVFADLKADGRSMAHLEKVGNSVSSGSWRFRIGEFFF